LNSKDLTNSILYIDFSTELISQTTDSMSGNCNTGLYIL